MANDSKIYRDVLWRPDNEARGVRKLFQTARFRSLQPTEKCGLTPID